MGALREILARFRFDVDEKALESARDKTNEYADTLKEVAGVLLGEELVEGIKGFVTELADQAGALQDAADRLNVNAQELQRWQWAATFAGASAEDLNKGLKVLTKSAADAANGAGDAGSIFKKLGVEIKDASGRIKPANELLEDTLIALAKVEDPAQRATMAQKLLGEGAGALLPLMKDGEEGLDALLGKINELGGGLSDDALEVLGESGDRIDEFNFAITSLKSRLAVSLLPTLNQAIAWVTKTGVSLQKAAENTHIFKAAVIVLGAAAGKVAIGMYAKYLPIVALIALLILLADDLMTFFDGGNSAVGKLLETLFGEAEGKAIADQIREDWKDLMADLEKLPDLGSKVEEVFSRIGGTVVKFLADDIPEAWRYFWKDMNEQAGNSGTTFIDFLKDMFSDLGRWLVDWASEAASDLVDSLADGISNAADKAGNKIKGFFRGIITGGEQELDVNSPSGETAYLGDMAVEGTLRALAAGAPKVRDQARATFGEAISPHGYAPAARVPSVSPTSSGDTYKQVDITARIEQSFSGGTPRDYQQAARTGVNLGLDDSRRAMMATLAPEGG